MQKQEKQNKQTDRWKQYIPYGIVIAGVIATGGVYLSSQSTFQQSSGFVLESSTLEAITNSSTKATTETQAEQTTKELVIVYVCGAVNKPGVYALSKESRLLEAIEAAGGFAEDAWQDGINLARVIVDAEQIYVPNEEERISGQIPVGDSNQNTNGETKLNLNTATKEQLMELPGIGEAKAESILKYRQEQGKFTSPEDIMNITGIKEALFNKIKDFITV